MKNIAINPIRLTIPFWSSSIYEAIDLGLAFKDQAEKSGGRARVYRDPLSIRIELEGLTPRLLKTLIDAVIVSRIKASRDFSIISTERKSKLVEQLIHGEITGESLTKGLIRDVPSGAWLVSNDNSWSAHVEAHTDRQRLWEHAVKLGLSHRKAFVVWSEGDVTALLARRTK